MKRNQRDKYPNELAKCFMILDSIFFSGDMFAKYKRISKLKIKPKQIYMDTMQEAKDESLKHAHERALRQQCLEERCRKSGRRLIPQDGAIAPFQISQTGLCLKDTLLWCQERGETISPLEWCLLERFSS